MERFERVRSGQEDVIRLNDNVRSVFDQITSKQIIDGQLLNGITLTTGITNNVSHKLGRKALGFIVVNRNANSQVWSTASVSDDFLFLTCSANVTISLWVF